MKTLDEVITALEERLGIGGEDAVENCLDTDALHYLKAYKDDRNDLTALRAYWKEQHENPELTWDELRQMEGKPVWVEEYDPIDENSGWHRAYWVLVSGVYGDGKMFANDNSSAEMEYLKDDIGKTWQAYRKERDAR